jgi:hypothetical protein
MFDVDCVANRLRIWNDIPGVGWRSVLWEINTEGVSAPPLVLEGDLADSPRLHESGTVNQTHFLVPGGMFTKSKRSKR